MGVIEYKGQYVASELVLDYAHSWSAYANYSSGKITFIFKVLLYDAMVQMY